MEGQVFADGEAETAGRAIFPEGLMWSTETTPGSDVRLVPQYYFLVSSRFGVAEEERKNS